MNDVPEKNGLAVQLIRSLDQRISMLQSLINDPNLSSDERYDYTERLDKALEDRGVARAHLGFTKRPQR